MEEVRHQHTQEPPKKEEAEQALKRHHQQWVRRAGQAAGLLYLAGDIAFMVHASKAHNGGLDKLKMTRGLAYLLGSFIILNSTFDKKKSGFQHEQQEKIRRELNQDLADAGISQEQSEGIEQWVRKELKQHPWEMAHLLFLVGTGMQGASAVGQKRWTEAAATLGTMTAIMIPVAFPEGDQKPFIRLSDNMAKKGHHFAESYKHIKQAMPFLKPVFNLSDAVITGLDQHPLGIAASLAFVSNAAYGVQALQKQPVEKGLAMMSGTYVAANVATAFASKNVDEQTDWDKHADELNEKMSQDKSVTCEKARGL